MFASSLNLSNPKLPLLAGRAKNAIDLAMIKAIAHRKDPSQNPLPADPRSLERAFNDVISAIPKHKQDKAMAQFQSLLSPAERTRFYGDLGQVNFASATSVVDQVTALPVPAALHFTESELADLQKQVMAKKAVGQALKNIGHHAAMSTGRAAGTQRAIAPQLAVASSMSFDVISATCVKPNDLRKDEINMAVGTVDGFGAALNAGPFFVGNFKKGETVDLGASGNLFDFKLAGVTFPATFPAFAFMIESDVIHNVELAEKLADLFSIIAISLQIIAVGILVVGALGVITEVPALVAALVVWIAAGAFAITGHYVMSILSDDISAAASDILVLDTAPAPDSTFERILTIHGFGDFNRGTYNVLLRWTAVL